MNHQASLQEELVRLSQAFDEVRVMTESEIYFSSYVFLCYDFVGFQVNHAALSATAGSIVPGSTLQSSTEVRAGMSASELQIAEYQSQMVTHNRLIDELKNEKLELERTIEEQRQIIEERLNSAYPLSSSKKQQNGTPPLPPSRRQRDRSGSHTDSIVSSSSQTARSSSSSPSVIPVQSNPPPYSVRGTGGGGEIFHSNIDFSILRTFALLTLSLPLFYVIRTHRWFRSDF